MPYFPDRYDAFPASPMALNNVETFICDASAMTYCSCIPRDMNHPKSDKFNNNTVYVMFTHYHHFVSCLIQTLIRVARVLPNCCRYVCRSLPRAQFQVSIQLDIDTPTSLV